jgi:hypothetical protein
MGLDQVAGHRLRGGHRPEPAAVPGRGGVVGVHEPADQLGGGAHARRTAITEGSGSLGFVPVVLLPRGQYEV